MLQILHPTYTLRLRIQDRYEMDMNNAPPKSGYRYFNHGEGKTGCDEVLAVVRDALAKAGVKAEITFDKFNHEG